MRTAQTLIRLHEWEGWSESVWQLYLIVVLLCPKSKIYMTYIMRKRVYAIYKQQRHRSPAHSHNLISAFLVCCRDSIIPLLGVSKISSLWQAFEAEQAGLCRKPRRQVFLWRGSFNTTQQLMRDGKNMFCETCIFMECFYWLSLVSQDEVLSSWKDLQQCCSYSLKPFWFF